jgi:hypothetical protein
MFSPPVLHDEKFILSHQLHSFRTIFIFNDKNLELQGVNKRKTEFLLLNTKITARFYNYLFSLDFLKTCYRTQNIYYTVYDITVGKKPSRVSEIHISERMQNVEAQRGVEVEEKRSPNIPSFPLLQRNNQGNNPGGSPARKRVMWDTEEEKRMFGQSVRKQTKCEKGGEQNKWLGAPGGEARNSRKILLN